MDPHMNKIVLKTHIANLDDSPCKKMHLLDIYPPPDLSKYDGRLRTFKGWPLSFISPKQMAKAGLYYLGIQDLVRCLLCAVELQYWERGVDPSEEHKKKSPECPFFKNRETYDECGLYGCPTFDLSSTIENKKIQDFLLGAGIVIKMNPVQHQEFSAMITRLDSFKKWDIQGKPNIEALCEAGFFFHGKSYADQLLCFCCGVSLSDWSATDEPWTEHARWSQNCSFLLLHKGKKFVDKACDLKIDVPKIDQNVSFKLISYDGDVKEAVTDHENATNDDSIEDRMRHIFLSEHERRKMASKDSAQPQKQQVAVKQPFQAMVDSALCKICFRARLTVAFLPCAHLVACIQCALKVTQCAVCRYPFDLAMTVRVYMDELTMGYFDINLPHSLPKCYDLPSDLMVCKVCGKEELGSAFVPCKHVYACVGCAKNMDVCPACLTDVCTTMQVYI